MKLLKIIEMDWTERLPFYLHKNSYRGFNRHCFQLLVIIYYCIKDLLLLCVAFYYFFFKGLWFLVKWIFRLNNREWFIHLKERLGIYGESEEDDGNDYENDLNLPSCTIIFIDKMSGVDFEHFCADLLRVNGWDNIQVTSASGDHGIDITAQKDDINWGFQCKRWNSTKVDAVAIGQTDKGKAIYECDIAVIITTSTLTAQAESEARQLGIKVWGRHKIRQLMSKLDNADNYYLSS